MRSRLFLLGGQTVSLSLMMAFLVVPVSSLFLAEYGADALPYAYLAVAGTGVLVSAAMTRAQGSWSLARVSATLLVRGARVLDSAENLDEPPVRDMLIRGGAIEAIGEALQPQGARVLDAAGMLAIPGFVNAHYHSHDVLARGMFEDMSLEHWGVLAGPLGVRRPLAEVRARTLAGAVECLRNGITTVQDMAAFSPMDEEVLDTILGAYAEAGIRVVFGVTVRDLSQMETILHLDELVPPALREVIGTARDPAGPQIAFVERQIERIGERGGMLRWALTPSAPQRCTPALLEAIAELSRRRSLPVYTHVYESRLQRVFAYERLKAYGGSAVRLMQASGLLGPHLTIAHGVWPPLTAKANRP